VKVTRRQLRKLILKEFLNMSDQKFNIKDFDRLGSDSGNNFLPPVEPPRGGGGGGGRDPSGPVRCYDNSLYDDTYNKVLDAFNDYLYMNDIQEYEYHDTHEITWEEAIEIMSNIAMAVCTGSLNMKNIVSAFDDPTGYL
jgi:hypothetical protein